MKIRKDTATLNIVGYFVVGVVALLCLIPFVMVISASFTPEKEILENGFHIFPRGFSLEAYKTLFQDPNVVLKAYGVTIGLTAGGTFLGLFFTAMTAYVLQRRDFEWRNKFSFFFYFTTLFNGGLTPWYIMMVKYLGMKNNYLALLLPLLLNVFNLLIMKNYMRSIPDALTEAAKIDGCGDFSIFIKVILPLSKPSLATVGLFIALAYWNDWYNAMLFINDDKMYPLQFFLYQKVNNIEAYKRVIAANGGAQGVSLVNLPTESLKMALTIIVTGPIILLYPLVQRYFVQGITIGAVKG